MLGSVCDAVVREAACPVLVIGSGPSGQKPTSTRGLSTEVSAPPELRVLGVGQAAARAEHLEKEPQNERDGSDLQPQPPGARRSHWHFIPLSVSELIAIVLMLIVFARRSRAVPGAQPSGGAS